jgi:diadenylate cyclase
MLRNLQQLIPSYEPLHLAIELAVIWLCVYIIFRFLQGTRGAGVIKGFAVVLVVGTITIRVLAQASDAFTRLNFLYDKFLGLVAILLIVVFQPELRQAMSRLGRALHFRTRGSVTGVVDAVSQAVEFLSKNQFGALIAIERTARLGGLIETGTALDAKVEARLLESIFWPNNPLHDLGVVIRGDRILAACVQFPLAEEGMLATKFGSRHRAAAGLSLESDCVVIIVSEETGGVSLAEHGRIEEDIPLDEFARTLARRLAPGAAAEHPTATADDDAPAADAAEPDPGDDPNEKQAA